MRRFLTILALVGLLSLTACDVAGIFRADEDGKSDATEAVETVRPFIPDGVPRLVADLVLAGLALTSGILARKGASKELAKNEAREYTLEEAESMLAAMEQLSEAGRKTPTRK